MSEMSIEEAIHILDHEISADKYYAGFNNDKTIEKVEEACEVACSIMRSFKKLKKLYAKVCEQCDKLEKENIELTDLDKLIDSIPEKRKIQYYDNSKYYHSYWVEGEKNPCGCGSNVYHLEYDGKKIYGVCNACNADIYEYKDEYIEEKLKQGIWK